MTTAEKGGPSLKEIFGRAGVKMARQITPYIPDEFKEALGKMAIDVAGRLVYGSNRATQVEAQKDPKTLLREKLTELKKVRHKLPKCVVIIPDGNRREAAKRGLTVEEGHDLGARVLYENLSVFDEFPEIENVVLWSWSEDNEEGRPGEKAGVFGTMAKYLEKYTPELVQKDYRITSVGRTDRLTIGEDGKVLPEGIRLAEQLQKAKNATCGNNGPNIIIAIDYGESYEDLLNDRELVRGGYGEVELTPEIAHEIRVRSMGIPEPDLVVRTSGEQRLSKFPYGSHAELKFLPVNLALLKPYMVADILLDYTGRDIRKGT